MEEIELQKLFDELLQMQAKKLLAFAREIVPQATLDDILQPNDFPELENHPQFRYEEGIWHGMQVAQAAIFALARDLEKSSQD